MLATVLKTVRDCDADVQPGVMSIEEVTRMTGGSEFEQNWNASVKA